MKRYLGPIHCTLVKDSENNKTAVRDADAAESFFHNVYAEAHAIARAHVQALGGNALLSFNVIPQESSGRGTRSSQRYSIITVSGDAVVLEHDPEYAARYAEANAQALQHARTHARPPA